MTITRALGFTFDTQTGAVERWAAGDPASVAEHMRPLTGTPPAMTHAEAVAAFPGWRPPTDAPALGEMVEVAMFAGRVGNPWHPGYPGRPWIEQTTLLYAGDGGRRRPMFGAEIAQTGIVIAWRPVRPCRCGPDGCADSGCAGRPR